MLEAIYEAPPRDMAATQDPDAEEDDGLRRVGGPVEMDSGDVRMRILLDHSCVEVYLATGEVLSTRIYRSPSSYCCLEVAAVLSFRLLSSSILRHSANIAFSKCASSVTALRKDFEYMLHDIAEHKAGHLQQHRPEMLFGSSLNLHM